MEKKEILFLVIVFLVIITIVSYIVFRPKNIITSVQLIGPFQKGTQFVKPAVYITEKDNRWVEFFATPGSKIVFPVSGIATFYTSSNPSVMNDVRYYYVKLSGKQFSKDSFVVEFTFMGAINSKFLPFLNTGNEYGFGVPFTPSTVNVSAGEFVGIINRSLPNKDSSFLLRLFKSGYVDLNNKSYWKGDLP